MTVGRRGKKEDGRRAFRHGPHEETMCHFGKGLKKGARNCPRQGPRVLWACSFLVLATCSTAFVPHSASTLVWSFRGARFPRSSCATARAGGVESVQGEGSQLARQGVTQEEPEQASKAIFKKSKTSWVVESIRSRFGVRNVATVAAAAAAAASMGSMQAAPKETSSDPHWRLKRSDLRKIYNSYAQATEKDASRLTVPTEREKLWIPEEVRQKRADFVETAKAVNAALLEVLVADLPPDPLEPLYKNGIKPATDQGAATNAEEKKHHKPHGDDSQEQEMEAVVSAESCKDVLEIKEYEGIKVGSQAYASMASLFLHLFRDWSQDCEHVHRDVYARIVEELRSRLPVPKEGARPSVMIPGAGLSRLSYEVALEGYDVESNEYSAVFCTVADWLFNRCDKPHTIYPLAHVFGENREYGNQYTSISVPAPLPRQELSKRGLTMRMTAGDFTSLYSRVSAAKGPAYRKFDCVVTCFFIDTGDDLIDYIQTIDALLDPGGLWINLGPLNYKKDLRLKLNWEEIEVVFKSLGYTFLSTSQVHTAYHMAPGAKLYTEQYDAVFSTAVKRAS